MDVSDTGASLSCREELEKQKAHERYLKLQEQGKTEQSKKDLGERFSEPSAITFNLFNNRFANKK